MGGSNSGRDRIRPHLGMFLWFGVKDVADIASERRAILTWKDGANIGVAGAPYGVQLHYTKDGHPISQWVAVERLLCHFGGTRPVLRCPRCDRRCRKLYLYGSRFVCRACTRARYWTQTASPDARMVKRIRKLQRRLAPDEDPDDYVIDWVPDRPRGMRQRTYERLTDQLTTVVDKRDAYLEPGLMRMLARYVTPEILAEWTGDESDDTTETGS